MGGLEEGVQHFLDSSPYALLGFLMWLLGRIADGLTWGIYRVQRCFGAARSQPRTSDLEASVELRAPLVAGADERPTVIREPSGWGTHFHHPSVLKTDRRFRGAVWDKAHSRWKPDGVVLFQNSPLSNSWPCNRSGVRLLYRGKSFRFQSSEAVIMAFKEALLMPTPLSECLEKQARCPDADASKKVAESATRDTQDQTCWVDHGVHVVLGTLACYLKFSQDALLANILRTSGSACIIDTAANDGLWGAARSSADFLELEEDPSDFALASVAHEELTFRVGGKLIRRECCHANALGKALMLVREMQRWNSSEPSSDQQDIELGGLGGVASSVEDEPVEVEETLQLVVRFFGQKDNLRFAVKWRDAAIRLTSLVSSEP